MKILAALLMLLVLDGGAEAGVTQAVLNDVAVEPKPGAALPLALRFLDENAQPRVLGDVIAGKPAVVVFMDYTCRTLCGPILTFVAGALGQTGLAPGKDYKLVVIGLDPKDPLQTARAAKATRIGNGTPLAAATVMLTGRQAAVTAATAALGYHYTYDAENDQFAHPAAAFVVNPAGKVSRVLSPIGLDGQDLRLALVEAGEGRVGTLGDRLRLLCYGFDATRGVYTESITLWLEVAAVVTMASMGAAIAAMNVKSRRAAPPASLMNSAECRQDARGPTAS